MTVHFQRPTIVGRSSHDCGTIVPQLWDAKLVPSFRELLVMNVNKPYGRTRIVSHFLHGKEVSPINGMHLHPVSAWYKQFQGKVKGMNRGNKNLCKDASCSCLSG